MGRLNGRVALVTGAASGIGRATAQTLAREGARVIATDLNAAGVETVVQGIRAGGASARSVHQDVTREDTWRQIVDDIRLQEGSLHILVNNAGIAWAGSILEMTLADWRRQQAVNLEGVFLGIRTCVPLIRDSGGGSIINISSVAGLRGSPVLAGYCATKGGVRLLTKGVALESAHSGWNVRVNSVHPGVIDTSIWQTVSPAAMRLESNAVDPHEIAAAGTPGGKAGHAQDIANGVLFLASDESAYMNGSELVIDMGSSA